MAAEIEIAKSEKLWSEQLALLDAYWHAANYLSVGQIYLYGLVAVTSGQLIAQIDRAWDDRGAVRSRIQQLPELQLEPKRLTGCWLTC